MVEEKKELRQNTLTLIPEKENKTSIPALRLDLCKWKDVRRSCGGFALKKVRVWKDGKMERWNEKNESESERKDRIQSYKNDN